MDTLLERLAADYCRKHGIDRREMRVCDLLDELTDEQIDAVAQDSPTLLDAAMLELIQSVEEREFSRRRRLRPIGEDPPTS